MPVTPRSATLEAGGPRQSSCASVEEQLGLHRVSFHHSLSHIEHLLVPYASPKETQTALLRPGCLLVRGGVAVQSQDVRTYGMELEQTGQAWAWVPPP